MSSPPPAKRARWAAGGGGGESGCVEVGLLEGSGDLRAVWGVEVGGEGVLRRVNVDEVESRRLWVKLGKTGVVEGLGGEVVVREVSGVGVGVEDGVVRRGEEMRLVVWGMKGGFWGGVGGVRWEDGVVRDVRVFGFGGDGVVRVVKGWEEGWRGVLVMRKKGEVGESGLGLLWGGVGEGERVGKVVGRGRRSQVYEVGGSGEWVVKVQGWDERVAEESWVYERMKDGLGGGVGCLDKKLVVAWNMQLVGGSGDGVGEVRVKEWRGVMPRVGRTVKQVREERGGGKMGLEEAMGVIRDIGNALKAIHQLGMIHADVHEENICWVERKAGGEVRGVKEVPSHFSTSLPSTSSSSTSSSSSSTSSSSSPSPSSSSPLSSGGGWVLVDMGSVRFLRPDGLYVGAPRGGLWVSMAMEQFPPSPPATTVTLDVSTDTFSLVTLLYTLLTASPPFRKPGAKKDRRRDIQSSPLRNPPTFLHSLLSTTPLLPIPLHDPILQAIAPRREERGGGRALENILKALETSTDKPAEAGGGGE